MNQYCKECNWTGWIITPDGGAGRADRCKCQTEGKLQQLLEYCGIPEDHRERKLRTYNDTWPSNQPARQQLNRAKAMAMEYVAGFERWTTRRGMIWVGNPGAGKTRLAEATLLDMIRQHSIRGLLVDFSTFLHRIQDTFDNTGAETKSQILQPIVNAEFLVLDELGARRPTDWVMDVLYLVVNTRYVEGRPTCFTTNFAISSAAPRNKCHLSTRVQPPLLSRIFEMAAVVDMTAVPDFREQVKSQAPLFPTKD